MFCIIWQDQGTIFFSNIIIIIIIIIIINIIIIIIIIIIIYLFNCPFYFFYTNWYTSATK